MSKNLVFQYADYDESNTLWKKSSQSVAAYAKFFTEDYKLLTKGAPRNHRNGIFVPFLEGWYKDYDHLIYVECDILATDVSANIVGLYDETDINAGHANTGILVKEKIITEHPYWTFGPVDDGVVIIPRTQYDNFMKYVIHCQENDAYPSNGNVMHEYCMFKNKDVANLEYKFNYRMDRYEPKKKFWQTFIHYKEDKEQLEKDFDHPKFLK